MKVSLKLEDNQQQNPIHFKAKIPIAVFGLPFLSAFSATHHSTTTSDHLSLSLRTHFHSGPTLKLSYNTPTSQTPIPNIPLNPTIATSPLTLTLKSGISLSGSPNNSPLIISANFGFSPNNPANPNPTFMIHFKPKLGSFSLRKSISSVSGSETKKVVNGGGSGGENENSYGVNWKELTVDSATKGSILSGVLMSADTELPVTKSVKVNLRWGVGVGSLGDIDKQLPYLRVNKIKIERIEVKEENENGKVRVENGLGEFEMFKGMYSWMSKELSDLQNENREMRRALEDLKSRQMFKNKNNGYSVGGKRVGPVVESSDGFEQWRAKKSGVSSEASGQREVKKNGGGSSDVESELQRAIKAASASS